MATQPRTWRERADEAQIFAHGHVRGAGAALPGAPQWCRTRAVRTRPWVEGLPWPAGPPGSVVGVVAKVGLIVTLVLVSLSSRATALRLARATLRCPWNPVPREPRTPKGHAHTPTPFSQRVAIARRLPNLRVRHCQPSGRPARQRWREVRSHPLACGFPMTGSSRRTCRHQSLPHTRLCPL